MPEMLHTLGPVARIASNPLFAGLEPKAVGRILECAARSYYKAGETVLEHSTREPVLYIVEAGLLFLAPAPHAEIELRSRLTEPGDVLNQRSFLCGDLSLQRAVAALPSIVISIDRRDLHQLEAREPAVIKRLTVNAVRTLMPEARPTAQAAAM